MCGKIALSIVALQKKGGVYTRSYSTIDHIWWGKGKNLTRIT